MGANRSREIPQSEYSSFNETPIVTDANSVLSISPFLLFGTNQGHGAVTVPTITFGGMYSNDNIPVNASRPMPISSEHDTPTVGMYQRHS